jgi:hypothetical protein
MSGSSSFARADSEPTGAIGLARGDDYIIDMSFDILSLEALFLVPR